MSTADGPARALREVAGVEVPDGGPDETVEKPAEPLDYAVFSAAYGSLLGALLLATRSGAAATEPITGSELVPMGAATFTLSKLVVHEKVESWVRAPFVAIEDGERRPKGRRLRYVAGELLTCTRCVGGWSALGIVALRVSSPPAGRAFTAILAASAMNDFLQAGFRWACAKSNEVQG